MRKLTFFLILFIVSCHYNTARDDLSMLLSKSITFPQEGSVFLRDIETSVEKYFDSDFKLIIYLDSTSCSSCAIVGLLYWEDLIEWSEQFDGALKYYFIFSPPKGENIKLALRNSMLDYPMLLDSLGEFERLNPHLPKNKAMHTFLLDEQNNVVLVGNPLHNPEIERMFKEIEEEKLGKKE